MKTLLLGLLLLGSLQGYAQEVRNDTTKAIKSDVEKFFHNFGNQYGVVLYQNLPHPEQKYGQSFHFDIKKVDSSFSVKSFLKDTYLEFDGKNKIYSIDKMSSNEKWELINSEEEGWSRGQYEFCFNLVKNYEGRKDKGACKVSLIKMLDLLKSKYNAKTELVKLRHETGQDGTENLTYLFISFDIDGDESNQGVLILHLTRGSAS